MTLCRTPSDEPHVGGLEAIGNAFERAINFCLYWGRIAVVAVIGFLAWCDVIARLV